jgi:hypothetical protein
MKNEVVVDDDDAVTLHGGPSLINIASDRHDDIIAPDIHQHIIEVTEKGRKDHIHKNTKNKGLRPTPHSTAFLRVFARECSATAGVQLCNQSMLK